MAISGIGGVINGVSNIREWSVEPTSAAPAHGSSATAGGTNRGAGVRDWTGSYRAYGPVPAMFPGGAPAAFQAQIGGGEGIEGDIVCESVEIVWDIEGGGIIEHTVNFGGDGAYALGSYDPSDAAIPEYPTSIGTQVELSAPYPEDFAELEQIRSITLRLTSNPPTYSSSGTGGWIRRGQARLDAELDIDLYTEDPAILPVPNTVYQVRLYTTATLFWLLQWMRFTDGPGITVPIEEPGMVEGRLSAGFHGHTVVDAALARGIIQTPEVSPVTIWPF